MVWLQMSKPQRTQPINIVLPNIFLHNYGLFKFYNNYFEAFSIFRLNLCNLFRNGTITINYLISNLY